MSHQMTHKIGANVLKEIQTLPADFFSHLLICDFMWTCVSNTDYCKSLTKFWQDKPWLALQVGMWCLKHILERLVQFSHFAGGTHQFIILKKQKLYFHCASPWSENGNDLLLWSDRQITILEIGSARLDPSFWHKYQKHIFK